jgi:DNA processing protein
VTSDPERSPAVSASGGPVVSRPALAALRRNCLDLAWRAAFDPGLILRIIRQQKADSLDEIIARPDLWSRRSGRDRTHAGADRHPARPHVPSNVTAITWVDAAYPSRLRHLADPPPAIFVCGRESVLAELETRPLVAVVGARAASGYGLEMTAMVVDGLVRAGVGVVSGLALGIDAAAHREALSSLSSATVAGRSVPLVGVLGGGVLTVHPRTNAGLFAALQSNGLLLSEYFWDLPALAWRFPARNRVIAALAHALVVVEGRKTSGARHTAAFASELPCEVFAVPGEAGRRLSELPHELLRCGAHLCEAAEDVLEVLESRRLLSVPVHGEEACRPASWWPTGDLEAEVIKALEGASRSVNELTGLTGRPVADVVSCLTSLHIDGVVHQIGGDRYGLVRRRPARASRNTRVKEPAEPTPNTDI